MTLALIVTALLLSAPDAGSAEPLACVPVRGEVSVRPVAPLEGVSNDAIEELHAVWTGSEVLVAASWAPNRLMSRARFSGQNSLLAYSPSTDRWRVLGSSRVHLRRPTFVWAGGRAVLWGGVDESASRITNLGEIIDPATGAIVPTSMENVPVRRQYHVAVAAGDRMFVFGGGGSGSASGWSCDGALLDPVRNVWTQVAPPPAEVCAAIQNLRLAAADAAHVALILATYGPHAQVRAAIYDLAQQRWQVGPPMEPVAGFQQMGTFGPDGAAYFVSSEPGRHPGAVLYRIEPSDAQLEALGPVCASGPVFRLGDRLLVVGDTASCEIDLARRRCVLPMGSVGATSSIVRQLLVPTDAGYFAWGFNRGVSVRFAPEGGEPSAGGNVQGAAISERSLHCGGAVPPPWEPGTAIAPAKDTALLIRRGDRNVDPRVVATVRTDAEGLFDAKLAPGRYCVVGESQRATKRKFPKGTDRETAKCLAEENARCAATFEVPRSGAVPLVVYLENACRTPCFRGPPPP